MWGSAFAVIFAPNHPRAARELARVCTARLGLTSWKRGPKLRDLYVRFGLDSPEGAAPFEWGREERVHELLGADFELEIATGTWFLEVESGVAAWDFWSSSAPPFKAMVEGWTPTVVRRSARRTSNTANGSASTAASGCRVCIS